MPYKKKLLLFDNCLIGTCNMHCRYCRNDNITVSVKDLNELEHSLERVSLLAQGAFDIPIIKISGYGEIFLLPNILKILKALSKSYERIQVITNATLLSKDIISRLSKIPGIDVCVSLDGHTPELNASRTTNSLLIKKVLNNISRLRDYKIPVEVNSVLTKYNISGFIEFINYLSDRYDSLTCYPFPARGSASLSALGPQNTKKLLPLVDSYQRFSNVLPPIQYIKRLLSFINESARRDKCYVGYVNLGLEPDGNIPVCACSIKTPLGNIFEQDTVRALKKIKLSPILHKFLFKELSFENCSGCFTHYEVINLFLDGTITLDEIKKIPLFGGQRTQKNLQALKKQLSLFCKIPKK